MIKPTIGRIVWYYPSDEDVGGVGAITGFTKDKEHAAIVCYVHSDKLVNLCVIDANGHTKPMTSVDLIQEGDSVPGSGRFATWMPYQIGQAKKDETTKADPAA
jgi:hypothetical protein